MKKIVFKFLGRFSSCFGLCLGLVVGLVGTGSAGPIIVGNGSGLSEFNILYWQRQLSYYMAQCRARPACHTTISAANGVTIRAAAEWVSQAQIQFEDETTLGKTEFLADVGAKILRLNKNALWIKSTSGPGRRPGTDLRGMTLEEVSDFMWIGLEPYFFQGMPGVSDFRNEFKKIIQARAGEYSVTLADGRRLATVSSENAVAGFAILNTDEKAEALLFSSLSEFGECQADDGTLVQGGAMRLQNLDFAFFVGRLGAEPNATIVSNVDLIFNGAVTYDCAFGGATWSEKANARLTIRLSQSKTAYSFVPSATRVHFDSIERL